MTVRKSPLVAVALAVVTLAGCSRQFEDDLFRDMNGKEPSRSPVASPSVRPVPQGDGPPGYSDNSRPRRPGAMSPRDEKLARAKAAEAGRALEELRRRGTVDPADVRPVIRRLAGSSRFVVGDLLVGTRQEKVAGADYGIWIGGTACVTGAVSKARVWAEANGRYLETGCISPPPAH
ncbi:hypothetical protein I5Q34_07945 [Streptomyces sp. AV19]|uniref:hypothetical protein n=1 Tax=Streptomyces sp. AV19 TaxID=2793068 RepID=UPI0018FEC951|nr:hypothetical protein [Streptomyces sp. AV19]MBH1934229.1 hypothetical protein [Streptomyces sp. AV19]MDG4536494.1 hypothetical protein [Streptomyces sp. AV19]